MMTSAETIRQVHQLAGRWRDLLWQSVLDEFAERDPKSAAVARDMIHAQPARALFGASTRDAMEAWPYLDVQARRDWLWVLQSVHTSWMEDIRSATATEATT
jgi:hypothetical protein